ncbi:alpha/beta fold hydrolase [Nocardia crassostreae]|uniref:alpha/beta fold hydrolase n=1 Tax=Nocardia crassostreae TaxID=53428 RepID=UPI00083715E3|nr:alpha/beta hydrolase [Nocardia crassostreae]
MTITRTTAPPAMRRHTVLTEDGVALAVREYGPRDADVTVVLVHGHCSSTESWSDLREALPQRYAGARVVCYDHRGHGESGAADPRSYHLGQLGRDLGAVLDAVAPTGPVVLVGHSMGGMAVLTYAAQQPHEIGARIVGAALVSTVASGLADSGLGRLLRHPLIALFQAAVRRAPTLMRHAKLLACKVFSPVARMAEYGDREVSPRVITLANAMHNATPIVTMASFLSAFLDFDRTDALLLLSRIPTLVLCGSADLMTPPAHSVAIAAGVDYADLVLVEGAGHSVILEQPDQVARSLVRLLARANTTGAARPAVPVLRLVA